MTCPASRAVRSASGSSLLECLIYCAVLVVVLGLSLAAFYRTEEHSRHLSRNATDIVRAVQAGERWRADVRAAAGPIRVVQTGVTNELHLPRSTGEVVYAVREGSVWRRANAGAAWEEFLPCVKTSQFVADRRTHVTAWRWEVELQTKKKVARVRPLFTFLAVPASTSKP